MAQLLQQIIERAKTYKLLRWHYRNPNIFNPYQLASIGYECTEINTIQCHICHHKIVFTTEEGSEKPESQLQEELKNHDEACCYKGEQYKTYSRPELYLRMDQLDQPIRQSYTNPNNEKLFPLLNLTKFKTSITENNQLSMLHSILQKYKMNQHHVRISFVLTVMGWQKKNMENLQCAFCGRCVNVKEFKITLQDRQKFGDVEENCQGELFDLFDEHRYFCMWVHDQKGWQIYIQHLYDKLAQSEQLFKNKDPEGMSKIRTLMDMYLHKFKNIIEQNFQKAGKILTECSQMTQQLQDDKQCNIKMREEVVKRKREMSKFLEDIQNEVRVPLKRIKID